MIDTCEFGYLGPSVGDAELRAFRMRVPGRLDVQAVGLPDEPGIVPVKWSGDVPGLGRVTLNRDGYLRLGGSLAKFRQRLFYDVPADRLRNDELLTSPEVNDTFQVLTAFVEAAFPFLPPSALGVTRSDVVYQRPVRSSYETLASLKGALVPTRLGCAWFDNAQGVQTGLALRGRAVSHRVYDKGLEAGSREFLNVLRSEEQLRKDSKAFGEIFDLGRRSFDREACREVLNNRYLDVAYGGQLDVSSLLTEGKPMQALLVLHPEFMAAYKQTVKKSSYNEMRRHIRRVRASAIPEDLRVPENAWLPVA